jgi:hypothetical protein
MNERIRELYRQAHTDGFFGMAFDPEKFAELIIRQCGYYADVFEGLGCPQDVDSTETKPSDYIKRQFGVEE